MIVDAAAAAYQHKMQHLLVLTEQGVLYAVLPWKSSNSLLDFTTQPKPSRRVSKQRTSCLWSWPTKMSVCYTH